jgi:hypothetical protein
MRVLIQNCATGQYYSGHGNWSRRAEDALDFQSTIAALNTVRVDQLKDAQVIFNFGGAARDLTLHLDRPPGGEKDLER